jgi:hypothetical protein
MLPLLYQVEVVYINGNLGYTITNTGNNAQVSRSVLIELTTVLKSSTAWVGFTAGCGGASQTATVAAWSYYLNTGTYVPNANPTTVSGNGALMIGRSVVAGLGEVWLDFTTTCSCIIESDPLSQGSPGFFRATQAQSLITFEFSDQSGCENAFQFTRDGTLLNSELNLRSQCFQAITYTNTGESMQLKNAVGASILAVGTTHQYCARAVGPPSPGSSVSYYSGYSCYNITLRWYGGVTGNVQMASGVGTSGVRVMMYFLTPAEQAALNPLPTEFIFDTLPGSVTVLPPAPSRRRQAQELQPSTHVHRRDGVERMCPTETAYDSTGVPLFSTWPTSQPNTGSTLACPTDLGDTTLITRACSAFGYWLPTQGSCATVLSSFTASPSTFVMNQLVVGPFWGIDAAHCAWKCLYEWSACNSFEVLLDNVMPRCVLSAGASFNTNQTRAISAPYMSITYYELTTNTTRMTVSSSYTEDASAVIPTLSGDCSMDVILTTYPDLLSQIRALETCR